MAVIPLDKVPVQRIHTAMLLVSMRVGHVIASIWILGCALVAPDSPRAWALSLGYDYLGSAATGGSLRETISSRANRARSEGRRWGCVLCRVLDKLDKDHCRKSAEYMTAEKGSDKNATAKGVQAPNSISQ